LIHSQEYTPTARLFLALKRSTSGKAGDRSLIARNVQGRGSRHRDRESIARSRRLPRTHGQDHPHHRRQNVGRAPRRSRGL